jgi:unsaturated chondroitin disaccharide hydrolase
VRGRTAHESIFNLNDGAYRCPNSQQGFSPFTTWTRGLAWAICGFAEQLEFLSQLDSAAFGPFGGQPTVLESFLRPALATADFYLQHTPSCGVPMWDTGAPNLHRLGDYLNKPADPFNDWEPVDSSAAAIAAQGLLRLGHCLAAREQPELASKYLQAGLSISRTLLQPPYLSETPDHQGLLLHSVYHRPNGWDYIPPGQKIPNGESSMWGDYHLRELGLVLLREAQGRPRLAFFNHLVPNHSTASFAS